MAMTLLFLTRTVSVEARNGDNYQADASAGALSYLRLPVSARAAALEGAFSALGDDAAGAMINPAVIARSTVFTVTTTVEWLTLDRQHLFGGAVYPIPGYMCSVGAGFVQYGVNNIERRDENGILRGEFRDLENTVALWFGSAFIDSTYNWGLAAKYHFNYLDDALGQGFSFDLGLFYQPLSNLNVAFTAAMLGRELSWNTGEKDPISPSFRTGLVYKPFKEYVNLTSDAEWTPGNYPQSHAGVECWIVPYFCLRGGLQGPNPIKGSGGLGIHHKNITVDYAFGYHQSTLGNSHILSIGIAVGPW